MHNHSEAFCLMLYRCLNEECGQAEWIWNSRDGVAPFIVGCRNCGGESKHTERQRDTYAPNFLPLPGSRYFADLTKERALEIARARVDRWWDDPEMPLKDHSFLGPLGREGAVESLAEAILETPGQPDILVAS